jgi:hypothetical protein
VTHSVLLRTEEFPFPTSEYGRLLQDMLGGIAYDHMARMNRSFGWVAAGLEADVASRLAASFEARGVPAVVREDASFSAERPRLTVSQADLTPASFIVHPEASETREIPWGEVTLISLGNVPRERPRIGAKRESIFVSGGGTQPAPRAPLLSTARRVNEKGALLHAWVRAPACVVSIRPEDFFYDYLRDRRRQVCGENLSLLIDDLRRLAGGAYWPPLSREYVETGEPSHHFGSEHEFSRYNYWVHEAFVAAGG